MAVSDSEVEQKKLISLNIFSRILLIFASILLIFGNIIIFYNPKDIWEQIPLIFSFPIDAYAFLILGVLFLVEIEKKVTAKFLPKNN